MVNNKSEGDKTEQQKAFENRQRAKEDRVLSAQGQAAARDYLGHREMPEDYETSTLLRASFPQNKNSPQDSDSQTPGFDDGFTRIGPICKMLLGGIVAAGIFGLSLGISYLKNRDSELKLVNPQDAYSLPSESTPRTQAYFVEEHAADKLEGKALEDYKRDIESDEILGVAREDAARRQRSKFSIGYKWDEQEALRRWRLAVGLPAEDLEPKRNVKEFSVEGYLIVPSHDTLSKIAERYQTRYGMQRTMDEIVDLNNTILTGTGLDILAECYGISEEEMRKQADKMPKDRMRYIHDKDEVWGGYVLPIPFIPKE